mgnify:CR=1 FL=1
MTTMDDIQCLVCSLRICSRKCRIKGLAHSGFCEKAYHQSCQALAVLTSDMVIMSFKSVFGVIADNRYQLGAA